MSVKNQTEQDAIYDEGIWEDCYQCNGSGGRNGDELMEEDPLWYSTDDWEECDLCKGNGGYLIKD